MALLGETSVPMGQLCSVLLFTSCTILTCTGLYPHNSSLSVSTWLSRNC